MANRCTVLLAGVFLASIAGCDEGSGGKGQNNGRQMKTTMVKTAGKFNQGYQDGLKEAQRSWSDWNGNDLWLWLADQQYQSGYQRGWNDGRSMTKLRAHQQKQMGDRDAKPAMEQALRNQPGEKSVAPKINDPVKLEGPSKSEKDSGE
ncbi:MAG: hypothetical protein HZA51_05290 [Planctomycetes bacterium]|nr:hypothetical protein [Planctomycetota bacterium]